MGNFYKKKKRKLKCVLTGQRVVSVNNMAGRLARREALRDVRRCGYLLFRRLWCCSSVTRNEQQPIRFLPRYNKLLFSTVSEAQQLKIEDNFFTHLHTKGKEMEGSLSLLLLLSARWNDSASVHRLLQQAETAGVRPGGHTMERVLNIYIKNKNLDAAVSLYADIQKEYSDASLGSCTVVNLCSLLVASGECLEGVRILREYVQSSKRLEVPTKGAEESCKTLLNQAAKAGSYEVGKELFDLLLLGRLVDPGPQVVAPLLQCKLDSNDLQGTVEVAEYIYHNFSTLPKRMEILIRLMNHHPPTEEDLLPIIRRASEETKEGGLLWRMFDLVCRCYGLIQALHDLLFACLESGHPTAAHLIFQTLAGDVDERQVLRMCKLYAKNEREGALEHLLVASQGMTNIDRLKIYEFLLDAYKLTGDKMAGEKGLSLWNSVQQEGLNPSPVFLSTLATLLATCNIRAPFKVS